MIKKQIVGAVLLGACLLSGTAYGAESATAQGSNTVLLVNGIAQEIYPYNIEGNNYFKLRDIASILSDTSKAFAVEWDEQRGAINLNTAQGYTTGETDLQFPAGTQEVIAEPSPVALYCDGQPLNLVAYNIGGNNYFKLRDIGEAVGFTVGWDDAAQLIELYTDGLETSSVSQGSYMPGMADGSDVELDESFINPDYWNSLPQLEVEIEEVEPEAGQQWEETSEAEATSNDTATTTGTVQTDVQQLLNSAALHPTYTQFGILNDLVNAFMAQNFTNDMDTYTKVKVAYDYFIQNMTYQTATELDMSLFTKEEAAVIWQHYPERYAVPILIDNKGVCNHYSSAYAAILQAIGLDVNVVSGKTKSSAGGYSGHVWVTVRIDGVDYLFDPQVDQRIAQRHNNVIQYYRFGKPVSALSDDYQADKQYQFADAL
jgi:hypothetical protein